MKKLHINHATQMLNCTIFVLLVFSVSTCVETENLYSKNNRLYVIYDIYFF